MDNNPNIHHRHCIRLKGYDYSKAGIYFITMCVQKRACFFGMIENYQMILNDAGRIVEKWFAELANKYPNIRCDIFVVMPNHIHCIIIKTDLTDTDYEHIIRDKQWYRQISKYIQNNPANWNNDKFYN
jgi:putative transposase